VAAQLGLCGRRCCGARLGFVGKGWRSRGNAFIGPGEDRLSMRTAGQGGAARTSGRTRVRLGFRREEEYDGRGPLVGDCGRRVRGWAVLGRKLSWAAARRRVAAGPLEKTGREWRGARATARRKVRGLRRTLVVGPCRKKEEEKRWFFLFLKQKTQTRFKRKFESNQPKIKCSCMYATVNSYISLFN
jgi:hypothetical protein